MTIFDYFKEHLRDDPQDETLKELPCDSNCGDACVLIINAAKKLLEVSDPHPNVRRPILEGVRCAISICWHG